MKLLVKKGRASLLVKVFIQNSSSTTGAGLTGLTNASAGLTCYRARDDDGNAGATQLVLSAGTRGTWSSGGFVEKDSVHMPGVYELGLDNAGLVTGSETVVYYLQGATNMAPCVLEIQLVAYDPQDTVRAGLTALPNAAANAVGGLPVLDANSLVDVDVKRWLATAVTATTAGVPDVNTKNIANVAAALDVNNLLKVDVEDWRGAQPAALSATLVQAAITGNVTVGGYAAGQDPLTLAFQTALTEGYAALHAAPTATQLLFEIRSHLAEKAVVGTTVTTRKIDGATQAATYTLNDPSTPTAITRAS